MEFGPVDVVVMFPVTARVDPLNVKLACPIALVVEAPFAVNT
jgi:hypothetical protein